MTPKEIMKWQEDMFIYSCYLYEELDDPVLSDETFDQHCMLLLRWWDDLSSEFKQRVSKQQLECGTALGLTYSDEEKAGALAWRDRVRALKRDQRVEQQ